MCSRRLSLRPTTFFFPKFYIFTQPPTWKAFSATVLNGHAPCLTHVSGRLIDSESQNRSLCTRNRNGFRKKNVCVWFETSKVAFCQFTIHSVVGWISNACCSSLTANEFYRNSIKVAIFTRPDRIVNVIRAWVTDVTWGPFGGMNTTRTCGVIISARGCINTL